jgi:peptidoglycan/LPS O-acetylase OafA/YrhL
MLVVVCAATLAVSIVLLLPWNLTALGKFMTYTAAGVANVAAWNERNYFMLGVASPLLHLWSIAVEEQFYLLYPLAFLLATFYFRRWRRAAVASFAVLSLGLCVWASYRSTVANYYLTPSRGWELLLGAWLALGGLKPWKNRVANEVLAGASLLSLVAVACFYQPDLRYPGLYTAIPCAAAGGLIFTGRAEPTLAGRILASPPLVFIGLISYSLYLWHMPAWSLLSYYSIDTPGVLSRIVLLAGVVGISVLSWRFVETPIRRREILRGNRVFLLSVGGAWLVLAVVAVALWHSDGLPWRFSSEARRAFEGAEVQHPATESCLKLPLQRVTAGDLCRLGEPHAPRAKVVVWGDSHALSLLPAYETLAATHRLQIYLAAYPSCSPLTGIRSEGDGNGARSCDEFNAAMPSAIARLQPDLVILNAYWGQHEAPANIKTGVAATLNAIATNSRYTCIVLDPPVFEHPVPYALAMADRRGIPETTLALNRERAIEQFASVNADLRALRSGRVQVVDLKDAMCNGPACKLRAPDGRSLYRDTNHLSYAGAAFVSGALDACFAPLQSAHE